MNPLPQLSELPVTTLQGGVAVLIAVGTLYCFLGYRTLRFVLALTGFILAGSVAGAFTAWLSGNHLIASACAAAFGGLCGAMALAFLYRSGVFLLGVLGVFVVGMHLIQQRPEPWLPWAVVGAGIVGGLVALVAERFIMTLATAAIGAWFVVSGIAFFLIGPEYLEQAHQPDLSDSQARIAFFVWCVLAVAGALAQFAAHKRKPKSGGKKD